MDPSIHLNKQTYQTDTHTFDIIRFQIIYILCLFVYSSGSSDNYDKYHFQRCALLLILFRGLVCVKARCIIIILLLLCYCIPGPVWCTVYTVSLWVYVCSALLGVQIKLWLLFFVFFKLVKPTCICICICFPFSLSRSQFSFLFFFHFV